MQQRTLKVPRSVRDLVRHLNPQMKRKVREALKDILKNPDSIGRHRIIYRPDDAGAEIVAFGPRKSIYDEMARQADSERKRK